MAWAEPAGGARSGSGSGSGSGAPCVPDGVLGEWAGLEARWSPLSGPTAPVDARGAGKSSVDRIGFAGSRRGLCVALELPRPDGHAGAGAAFAGGTILLELWPEAAGGARQATSPDGPVGVALRLGPGTQVAFVRPRHRWRVAETQGVVRLEADAVRAEVRLSLAALSPLPAAEVASLRYRVTVSDASPGSEPSVRGEGRVALARPLGIPQWVRAMPALRACMAGLAEALIGYAKGWRCAVPTAVPAGEGGDAAAWRGERLSYARPLDAPQLVWLPERLVVVKFLRAGRGLLALLDKQDRVLSVLPLGAPGAAVEEHPKSARSGAEAFRLPDGAWAVSLRHAYRVDELAGGQCAGRFRTELSIVALRQAPDATPQNPRRKDAPVPFLEEVFRTTLSDCRSPTSREFGMSSDRRELWVKSSLEPLAPGRRYVYRRGGYRPDADGAPR